MLKRLLCLSVAVALLGAAPPYSVHYEARRFADCNAASFFAADHPLVGLYNYRIEAQYFNTAIIAAGSLGFRGRAQIRYALAPGQSQMILPKWSWPNITESQREDLRDFVAALRNHELGHAEIALHAVARRESSITVLGATPAQARARLAAAGASQLRALAAEVLQTERTYDRVTGHGTEQSDGPAYGFRGGENVGFGCR